MEQAFVGNARTPVTIIQAGPCIVTSIKTLKKDGYWAVQLGFGEKKIKNITKPLKGHLKGAVNKDKAPSFLKEVKLANEPDFKSGDVINISDVLNEGDAVQVTGVSKGKGFTGVIKRWGFATSGRTHGQKAKRRAGGSIGQGTTPGRVRKGKKMAGRAGSQATTVKNLKVVSINKDRSEIKVSGPIPGSPGGFLVIKKIKSSPRKKTSKNKSETETKEDAPFQGRSDKNDKN